MILSVSQGNCTRFQHRNRIYSHSIFGIFSSERTTTTASTTNDDENRSNKRKNSILDDNRKKSSSKNPSSQQKKNYHQNVHRDGEFLQLYMNIINYFFLFRRPCWIDKWKAKRSWSSSDDNRSRISIRGKYSSRSNEHRSNITTKWTDCGSSSNIWW